MGKHPKITIDKTKDQKSKKQCFSKIKHSKKNNKPTAIKMKPKSSRLKDKQDSQTNKLYSSVSSNH